MSESIFEHTTSIAGLTCKPLSILSETISPQEMNMVRGGNGCNDDDDDDDPIDMNTTPGPGDVINTYFPSGGPVTNDLGEQGPPMSPADWYNQGEPADAYLYGLTDDPSSANPFDENYDPNETIGEADKLSQDESDLLGDGDCGDSGFGDDGEEDDSSWLEDIWDWLTGDEDEDEDDNGSGLDGMEGDFDPSQDEMLV